jgi:hypothetical protein
MKTLTKKIKEDLLKENIECAYCDQEIEDYDEKLQVYQTGKCNNCRCIH